MTNYEKYKTPEEAFTAKVAYCKKYFNPDKMKCPNCPITKVNDCIPCNITWLYMNENDELESINSKPETWISHPVAVGNDVGYITKTVKWSEDEDGNIYDCNDEVFVYDRETNTLKNVKESEK